MKTLANFAALAAFTIASAGAGSAATLTLASYGSTSTAPTGVSNTGLLLNGSTPTYNVPTGGIWGNPVGNSSWVGTNPNDYPGGGNYPANGVTYVYTTTFTDLTPTTSSGSIMVMADDTTSVYLNNVLITSSAPPSPAANCTVNVPNCKTPATYTLTGFITGVNTLTFNVSQLFDNASGIDFAATVNTTVPEPSSLLLLGTGLLGIGSRFRRRRTA